MGEWVSTVTNSFVAAVVDLNITTQEAPALDQYFHISTDFH